MTTLYMVATPIGNLGDMTYRAIETLKKADLIVCEDTRRAKVLCDHYDISRQRVSFHAQTTPKQLDQLVEKMKQNQRVAYVTDAGTPGVSDPGYRLLRACLKESMTIVPIPGASALTCLMSVAGIPVGNVSWIGFLPHKKGRKTIFEGMVDSKQTHAFYESVHRFPRLLTELQTYLGDDRVLVVGRELTKKFEDVFRGTVQEALQAFTSDRVRGEFCVFVAPAGFTFQA